MNEFLGVQPEPIIVYYVRSSDGNKTLKQNQINTLKKTYGEPTHIYQDSGSGLSENRRGLKQLLRDAKKGKFNTLAITQKDRLTRFGYSYLEELLNEHGVTIKILGEEETKTLEEELLQDFMSLVASFSGKFYRLRGYKQQQSLLNKAGDILNEKTKEPTN